MKHIFYRTTIVSVFAMSFFGFFIHTTNAYFTTDQKAFELDKGSALFTIDYEFGHKKHEIGMPFKATYADSKATDTVAFTILDKNNEKVAGKASGIVLSQATLSEGMYSVPSGHQNKFTLFVVFTPSATTTSDYRLQVTNLPFDFDGKQQLQLNPSELKYYTTPFTDF